MKDGHKLHIWIGCKLRLKSPDIEEIHSLKNLEILVDESMQQSVHKFITVPFFQHEKYIDDTIQILHKYNGSPQVCK